MFFAETLTHLEYEERVILPELQRLCSEQELKEIDYQSYRVMEPEELIQMLKILFPYMNKSEKHHFLKEIEEAVPEKFQIVCENKRKFIDA